MSGDVRDESLSLEQARWLVGPGLEVVRSVAERLASGDDPLPIGTHLRDSGLAADLAAVAMDAATARRRAVRDGVPHADALLLTSAALEQASHPLVATHRASRFAGLDVVVDLCCGLGADAHAIAAGGPTVLGVDLDRARLLLARHNADVVGADLHVVSGDAMAPPVGDGHVAHADPGRRRAGRRVRLLAQHQPPVGPLATALRARPGAGLVLSPAVDLGDPDLPVGELEFVQVGGRLVEAVAWSGDRARPGAVATATLLAGDGTATTRSRSTVPPPLPVAPPGAWLMEVAPALVRARGHHDLGLELEAWRVSDRRALLSADRPPDDGDPWTTAWAVEAVLPGRPRAVSRWLATAEPLPLSISLHGDARPIEVWWRAAKGQPRGPVGRRLLVVETERGVQAVLGRSRAAGIA